MANRKLRPKTGGSFTRDDKGSLKQVTATKPAESPHEHAARLAAEEKARAKAGKGKEGDA